jgi:hypothetical protein
MVQIFYNNQDAFSGVAPTPLMSQRNEFIKYGEQWGEVTHVTLYGNIMGGCVSGNNTFLITETDDNRITQDGFYRVDQASQYTDFIENTFFDILISGQQTIIANLSKDFQRFQVLQDGNILIDKPFAIIRNVRFEDSTYSAVIPFQIDIDCYESGFFSGVFGVLEPKNEFSFTQNKDQSITVQHSMSCKGFNTDPNNSNALQNAKAYIQSISGFRNQILPYFINFGTGSYATGMTPSLITQKETVDRVQGSYGIEETYIFDPFFTSGVLRYSATYDSGIADGISTVKLNGSLKSSRNYPIDFIRSRYLTFDSFSAAVDAYSGASNGLIDLNPLYLSSGVSEDPFGGAINFSIAFNNDQTPNPFLDYTVTFDRDVISDVTSANFEGTIRGRGDLKSRYANVLTFSSGVNPYNLTLYEYINNGYQYYLNPLYTSFGNTRNLYAGEITLKATYNDKILPVSGFANFEYSYDILPAIEKYGSVPLLDGSGNYYVTNLGFANRATLTIAGKAVILPNISQQSGIQLLMNFVNNQAQPFIAGKNRLCLDTQSITFGNQGIGKDLSFSVTWSYEDTILNI